MQIINHKKYRIMKEKILFLLVMSLLTLTNVEASGPSQLISLTRKHFYPQPPGPLPFSLDENDEITASLSDENLIISPTTTSTAYVTVTTAAGVVFANHVSLAAGAEYIIDIIDWTSGVYTLYILCDGDMWIGEFEIE